ncbi:acetyl-CoA synthetase-like protein [Phellopilus nigrolimitatus]|nr:acetyl-CoA synthetase-like protein [Phellopilus nigrolimitatus]
MPHVRSPYPPVPPLPPLNYHTMLFGMPPGNVIPHDFVVHIDGISGEQRTYGQFVERARDCATALAAPVNQGGLGVSCEGGEKEIVVILSQNCLDYMVLVHAALVLTVPFALLPSKPTLAELIYLLDKLKCGAPHLRLRIFAHPLLLDHALAATKQVGLPTEHIYLLDGRDMHAKRTDVASLIENARIHKLSRHPVVPAQKDTLAYLLFSSGTSGPPKAIMVSHGNLCFSTMQLLVSRQEDAKFAPPPEESPPRRWICFLPFYHAFGLHYYILRAFLVPNTMIILPRWNIDQALEIIPRYKINYLALVPSIVYQIVHSSKAQKADLTSVLFAGCGAAPLAPKLAERFRKMLGQPAKGQEAEIPEGYGLSEATIGSLSRPRPGQYGLQPDPASTGILIPGQEARIIRDDGSEADYDEPGELLLRGGNIVLGYWGDDEATRESFLPDGWLRTGDRFRVTKQGVFYYEDRMKDTLKISGAQVAPAEIERVLLTHPQGLVADVAVAGVPPPNNTRDERIPRAWVVLSESGRAVPEAEVLRVLDAWVREQLSRYKWLTGGIAIVNDVPKNPTGKVLRRVLVEGYVKEREREGRVKAKL